MDRVETSVSVIIPCYNAAKYLRGTLESALRQSHRPLEVIVVDDGSGDDSPRIAEACGSEVRVVRQRHLGAGVARHRGVHEARGRYVTFQDADDRVSPTKIADLLGALHEHPSCAAAIGITKDGQTGVCAALRSLGGSADGSVRIVDGTLQRMLIDGEPLAGAMNLLARREHAARCGRDRATYRAANDYDFQLCLARLGDFAFKASITCCHTLNPSGITGTMKSAVQPAFALCAAFEAAEGSFGPDAEVWRVLRKRLAEMWPLVWPGIVVRGETRLSARILKLALKHRCMRGAARRFWWGIQYAWSDRAALRESRRLIRVPPA